MIVDRRLFTVAEQLQATLQAADIELRSFEAAPADNIIETGFDYFYMTAHLVVRMPHQSKTNFELSEKLILDFISRNPATFRKALGI